MLALLVEWFLCFTPNQWHIYTINDKCVCREREYMLSEREARRSGSLCVLHTYVDAYMCLCLGTRPGWGAVTCLLWSCTRSVFLLQRVSLILVSGSDTHTHTHTHTAFLCCRQPIAFSTTLHMMSDLPIFRSTRPNPHHTHTVHLSCTWWESYEIHVGLVFCLPAACTR